VKAIKQKIIEQLKKDIELARYFQKFGQCMMGDWEESGFPCGNFMSPDQRKEIGRKLKKGKKLSKEEENWHWGLRFWAAGILDEVRAAEVLRKLGVLKQGEKVGENFEQLEGEIKIEAKREISPK